MINPSTTEQTPASLVENSKRVIRELVVLFDKHRKDPKRQLQYQKYELIKREITATPDDETPENTLKLSQLYGDLGQNLFGRIEAKIGSEELFIERQLHTQTL